MTLIRKLASVLLLASWLTSGSINSQELVPGQTYNTGNIVQQTTTSSGSTWVNGVYQNSLTCWMAGDPGYCGPNAIIRPGNNINFSYGSTYIYQQQNVSTILPSATGLRVDGYNFSFTAKNGNGWDDGRVDQLTALVRFWDSTGGRGTSNLLYGNSYNLSYKYNWTTFNYSETFASPLTATSIGQVQYGFIGKDNNFWSGPYGPEINNVSFSLKYSVDPCAKDVLSSPTCPGYLDALGKLTGSSTTTSTAAAAPTTATLTTVSETPTAPTTTVSLPPPAAVSTDLLSKAVENTKTSQAASAASITAATNLNDKSSVTAFALSVISKNAANERSLQEKAVGDAISQATAAATAAVEQSQALAISQSQASAAASGPGQLPGAAAATSGPAAGAATATTTNTNVNAGPVAVQNSALLPPTTQTASTENTGAATTTTATNANNIGATAVPAPSIPTLAELLPPQQAVDQNPAQGLTVAISSTPFAATSAFVPPVPVLEAPRLSESEANRNIDMSSPTDFVAGYLNTKHNLNDMQAPVAGPAVNNKAQDNEAAGSVTISSIATMPVGYDLYTSLAIKDAAFYKPEEVYRGQKTVDNQRLLRGLTGASDRVHQEMVDSQYKIRN